MKKLIPIIAALLLLAACGQSYEETKRITREQRREAMRKDSAALKVAVMPTLDCLPLYVAQYYQLFDSLNGGVRLKFYNAQMDCDTAILRGRVEGAVTDLVRAKRMEKQGLKLRYVAATNAYWQLVTNRNARIHQLKQLDDKMVAMTRFSATDLLTDRARDSVKLAPNQVFKVQINDLNVRVQMLQNNEIDAGNSSPRRRRRVSDSGSSVMHDSNGRASHQTPDNACFEYTVQPGDTLSLIAAAFNTTNAKIKKVNGLKGDSLKSGQTLLVPKD